ncbi:sodium:proton antiporter [Virgibacillus soli]|uniref:Na+/H+ antiporter NhaC family protein n=1 Tax=Lederbergia galactosidilytica TaxID=217031 RepID=UPI000714399C|nr:Na+/H+ antiporter NhaC family protein [Lederbergia galactosidilytica]KRG15195.1 sodium:proton antiporter [Virgibacillus soli]MBP1913148.1 Na+/H+ antiporter NhaC [Lederbergia galactosidilytica]
MEHSILSIIPPILAIVMVILTKRVLLSLGTGIIASALLLGKGSISETFLIFWSAVKGVFLEAEGLNSWNINLILFLLLLGVITSLINMTGGSRAFGEWATTKVKSRAGAQLLAAFLGVIIFIDDYFNALAVGQVARPITDRHQISRTKLAYIIDSTSAPICVISPISSWGAFIIGIIATVLASHGLDDISAFTAFIEMIPMNLYVWTSLLFVFIIAIRGLDYGSMKKHEERAIATGVLYDPDKVISGEVKENLPVSDKGKVRDLIWPIIALFVGTLSAIIISGLHETTGKASLMDIFGNADVALALVVGGLLGLVVGMLSFYRQVFKHNALQANWMVKAFKSGVQSMLSAVMILLFAWVIIDLIEQLGTGLYLGGLVERSNLNPIFLPVILFLGAAVMAFATGTSWGAFGILLPIAGQIIAVTDMALFLPGLAAVLAGAVMGDHCSPISDTTILSATGAGCNLMDHVLTQLPYAISAAIISCLGYIVIGWTEKTIFGLLTVGICVFLFFFMLDRRKKRAQI